MRRKAEPLACLVLVAGLGCALRIAPAPIGPHLHWPIDATATALPSLGIGHFSDARPTAERDGSAPPLRVEWRGLVRESFGAAAHSDRFDEFFDAVFDEFGRAERYRFFSEAQGVLAGLERSGHTLGIISNWDVRLRPVLEVVVSVKANSGFCPQLAWAHG